MNVPKIDVAIVGAGMAGLSCATQLERRGFNVRLFDKGRGPGGRMATRRTEIFGKPVQFDHGAQYFTAREPAFEATVKEWEADGIVARWPQAGEDAWVGVPGMNGPLRALAKPLDVSWNSTVESLCECDAGWSILVDGAEITCDAAIVAVPAEQCATLLDQCANDFAGQASCCTSIPCWTVMAVFAEPLSIGADCVKSDGGPITWAARNSSKPQRDECESWVIQASPERSEAILEFPPDVAARMLITDFVTQFDIEPVAAEHLAAHRWRYAMPKASEGDIAQWCPDRRVGITGDYLHSPRVEGAWLSGTALGERFLA